MGKSFHVKKTVDWIDFPVAFQVGKSFITGPRFGLMKTLFLRGVMECMRGLGRLMMYRLDDVIL